jgi:hypothetical protein
VCVLYSLQKQPSLEFSWIQSVDRVGKLLMNLIISFNNDLRLGTLWMIDLIIVCYNYPLILLRIKLLWVGCCLENIIHCFENKVKFHQLKNKNNFYMRLNQKILSLSRQQTCDWFLNLANHKILSL